MTRKIIGFSLLGIGLVMAAGLLAAAIARPVSAAAPAASNYGPGGWPGRGVLDEDLAAALGISTDQLSSAYQEAYTAALDQAVTEGLITQPQADTLKARTNTFPFGGHWRDWLSQNGIDFQALLAGSLGITPEELSSAYAQAFNARIDRAVEAGHLTEEQANLTRGRYALQNSETFRSALQSAFEQAVQQAVTDGVITQAQADQILAARQGSGFGSPEIGRFGGFGFEEFGEFGRHGRDGRFGPELPNEVIPPAQPTTSPTSGV